MQLHLFSFGRSSIFFFLLSPLFLAANEWAPRRLKNHPFQEPVWVQLNIVKDEVMTKYNRVDGQVEYMFQGGFWVSENSPKCIPEKNLIQKIQELPNKWIQKKSLLRSID